MRVDIIRFEDEQKSNWMLFMELYFKFLNNENTYETLLIDMNDNNARFYH